MGFGFASDGGFEFEQRMSAINVTSVQVLDNPQMFSSPLQFEIQYECLQDLRHGAWSGDWIRTRGRQLTFEIRATFGRGIRALETLDRATRGRGD